MWARSSDGLETNAPAQNVTMFPLFMLGNITRIQWIANQVFTLFPFFFRKITTILLREFFTDSGNSWRTWEFHLAVVYAVIRKILRWHIRYGRNFHIRESCEIWNVQSQHVKKLCLLAGESNPALPRSGDGGFRHWQAGVSEWWILLLYWPIY